MNTLLDKYSAREFVPKLLLCCALMLGVYYLGLPAAFGNQNLDLSELIAVAGSLAASLFFLRLSRSSEMIALFSLGIPVGRVARTPLIISTLVAITSIAIAMNGMLFNLEALRMSVDTFACIGLTFRSSALLGVYYGRRSLSRAGLLTLGLCGTAIVVIHLVAYTDNPTVIVFCAPLLVGAIVLERSLAQLVNCNLACGK